MANLYRFHCWETDTVSFIPSLIGFCGRTGRLGYFEMIDDLTPTITSLAPSNFQCQDDSDPLICVAHAHQPKLKACYATLSDLREVVEAANDQVLARLLMVVERSIPRRASFIRG